MYSPTSTCQRNVTVGNAAKRSAPDLPCKLRRVAGGTSWSFLASSPSGCASRSLLGGVVVPGPAEDSAGLDTFIDSSVFLSSSFAAEGPGLTQMSLVRGFAKHSPSSGFRSSSCSSSESSSMNSATSQKSVVPIHEPSSRRCEFALVVQSSMILNVLPDAKYLPPAMRIRFNGVFALGPPATLKGVNKARLPDRCVRVHRPSCPSFAHEST